MAVMATIKQRPGGMWEYRRRVPDRLRSHLGITEVRRSLDTKDKAEAKVRVAAVIAEVDRLFAAAGQVVTLDHRSIKALAAEWLSSRVSTGESSPPDALTIDVQISAIQDAHEDRRAILRLMSSAVDDLLTSKALPNVDQASREELSIALFWSDLAYWQTMSKRRAGDYSAVPGLANAPAFVSPKIGSKASDDDAPTSFASVWKLWVAADTDRAPKTVYEWGKKWDKLVAYIREQHGHDDAARVTKEQARAWVDSLKASDTISPRTINFGYIAVARAAYKVATGRDVLKDNPFVGLTLKINKVALARGKREPFTDEEARKYLQAARAHRHAWVRWVVLFMAYSGCRLGEVADARACDVRDEKGIPVLDICLYPGRRIKTIQSERMVPLHPSVVREGFIEYARSLPDQSGPLFPRLDPDRFGTRAGTATKVLGRVLRLELKITDKRKVQSHGWRHRLQDLGNTHDVPEHILNWISGHALASEGRKYGKHLVPKMAEQLARIPDQG